MIDFICKILALFLARAKFEDVYQDCVEIGFCEPIETSDDLKFVPDNRVRFGEEGGDRG